MLQLVQSTLRRQISMRRTSSWPKLLHQFQQVQNFLLEDVPSLDRFLNYGHLGSYGFRQ